MKVERAAAKRTQHTALANGKPEVSVVPGNLILEEGYAIFVVQSHVPTRTGGHYKFRVTFGEDELRAALESIEAARQGQFDSAEPDNRTGVRTGIAALDGERPWCACSHCDGSGKLTVRDDGRCVDGVPLEGGNRRMAMSCDWCDGTGRAAL